MTFVTSSVKTQNDVQNVIPAQYMYPPEIKKPRQGTVGFIVPFQQRRRDEELVI